jgi:hypothetical protein
MGTATAALMYGRGQKADSDVPLRCATLFPYDAVEAIANYDALIRPASRLVNHRASILYSQFSMVPLLHCIGAEGVSRDVSRLHH